MRTELHRIVCAFVLLNGGIVLAANQPETDPIPDTLFQSGQYELTLASGALFSPALYDKSRPTLNYTLTELQFGYMLNDVREWGWLRGNCEFAAEVFGGGVFSGRGTYVSGLTVWLRHNFVQPAWQVVPFVQAGVGLTETDADRRLTGQALNFNIDAGAGIRYLLARDWSLNLEYRYQHISNAKMASRDIGVNAHGPVLGVSYLF